MSVRIAPKFLLPLLAAVLPAFADAAACYPVAGTVRLMPDATCAVQSYVSGAIFDGQCFSVNLSLLGFPNGSGFAGTTTEPLVGANGVPTLSPAVIPVDGQQVPRQIVQTARTAVMLGAGKHRTTLYTTDVIVFQPQFSATGQVTPAVTTEQILIAGTDGKGTYAGAKGHLIVLGNSIGVPAPVTGKICLP